MSGYPPPPPPNQPPGSNPGQTPSWGGGQPPYQQGQPTQGYTPTGGGGYQSYGSGPGGPGGPGGPYGGYPQPGGGQGGSGGGGKGLLITTIVVGAVAVIAAITTMIIVLTGGDDDSDRADDDNTSSQTDEPTSDEPTEDEPTEDEPTEDEPTEDEPTADEPPPAPPEGTVALGEAAPVGDWTVTVDAFEPNADQAIADANQFNEPPKVGRYVLYTATVTYNGAGAGNVSFGLHSTFVGPSGDEYEDYDCGSVEPESSINVDELSKGESATFQTCFDVPVASIEGATIKINQDFDDATEVVFATQ